MKSIINKKVEALFKKANDFYKEEDYVHALLEYNKVLSLDELNHQAYFGMYMSWWNYSYLCKNYSLMIDELYLNAYRLAPKEIQEEYFEIYKKNVKKFGVNHER